MIKITKLELISFGKFKNTVIAPADGLNVVHGPNEAGKSTIQLFIKSMLYGVSPSRGKGPRPRERIIPWGESRAAGKLELVRDGIEIEIYREFGARPADDITKVMRTADGEEILGGPGSVGEKLLGMSESLFERTVWIAQDGAVISGGDEIAGRLMNILKSGSQDVSAAAAEASLKKQIAALKAKDRRSAPGEIDRLEAEKAALLAELERQKRLRIEIESARRETAELEAEAKAADSEKKRLRALMASERAKEKTERLKRLDACLAREIQLGNSRMFQLFKHKLKDDTAERLHGLSDEIDRTEAGSYRLSDEKSGYERQAEKLAKRKRLFVIVGIALAVIGICCAVIGAVFKTADLFSAAALIIIAPVGALVTRRKQRELLALLDETDKKISGTREYVAGLEAELSAALEELGCDTLGDFDKKYETYRETEAKIAAAREAYENMLGGGDYSEIKREADEARKHIINEEPPEGVDLEAAAEAAEQRRSAALERLAELKATGTVDIVPISDIENGIRLTDEKISESRAELDALRMALEGLAEAEARVRSDYTPLLNKSAGEILSGLTSGKHGDMRVAADFSVKLKDDAAADPKRAELFSSGTYSQMYLALRLAIAELIRAPEDTIVFMDDALTSFDDERAENAVRLLKERCGEGRQIIMFTCHGREAETAEKIGGINLIEITD